MPLHAEHEAIAARIFDSFDDAISSPGGGNQFPSQFVQRLVVMTVHRRALSVGQTPATLSANNRTVCDCRSLGAPC